MASTTKNLLNAPTESFRLALALQTIASKPAHLSIAEHIQSLRQHANSTVPRTDRYLDTVNYWRNRTEKQEALVESLRARVLELEIRPSTVGSVISTVSIPIKSKPRSCRAKGRGKESPINALIMVPCDPAAASAQLQSILSLLDTATEPEVISHAIRRCCHSLVSVVEQTTKTNTTPSPSLTTTKICTLVESVLTMSLKRTYGLPWQRRNEIGAVVVYALLELLRCVHVNSVAILENSGAGILDMRMEITKVVIGVLEALYSRNPTEGDVLIGFVYGFFGLLRAALTEGTVAVEETGWYYGLVLEVAWGLVQTEGKWVKDAKNGLVESLLKMGGWSKGVEETVMAVSGKLEGSPFACLVTGIVGMEIFT